MPAEQRSIRYRQRRGATALLLVLLMVMLVALVAFAVDVGRMYLIRAQLQTAVDAGTLAAAMQLKENDENVAAAVAAAEQFVQLNRVGWAVTVPDNAITAEAGTWDSDSRTFTATTVKPDAVRVFAQLEDEPLFFAGVLGVNTFSVPRDAIATKGGSKLDVIMVLDLSGSMSSDGRIEALQNAAPAFVNVIEEVGDDDQIGVLGYGALPDEYDPVAQGHNGTLYLDAPADMFPADSDWVGVLEAGLTDDFDHLRNNVLNSSTLTADKYNGWTPVGAAIRDAAHYLNTHGRTETQKSLVLMSDGYANKPEGNGPGYALSMAGYAASLGMKVYTISLGNSADEQLMEDIATATDAEYFSAGGSGSTELSTQLEAAFRSVAGSIKRIQLVQ